MPEEFYISAILGKSVLNSSQEKIGCLKDLIVLDINHLHPRVSGLIISRGNHKGSVFIPESDLKEISGKKIILNTDVVDLTPFNRRQHEVLLVSDLFDRQIVDIDDRRLTRVNDVLLEQKKGLLFVKGVDVSIKGILARLQLSLLARFFSSNVVDWEDTQMLASSGPLKFNLQYQKLEKMHPVDIARIIFEGPGYKQGSKVLTQLKDPIAADIIEELSPKLQKNLFDTMKTDQITDVIDHMAPDKATDVILSMGPEFAQKICPLLSSEQAQAIKALINYPEYSVGAFMTTDYIAVPAKITLEQLSEYVRKQDDIPDFMFYFFVVENEHSHKLTGVVSNQEIFTANPRTVVDSIMKKEIISVSALDHIREALKKMYLYELSALPVISRQTGKLLGIVTLQDAMAVYLPKSWQTRLRKIFSQ